jgi:hypothetical protein
VWVRLNVIVEVGPIVREINSGRLEKRGEVLGAVKN